MRRGAVGSTRSLSDRYPRLKPFGDGHIERILKRLGPAADATWPEIEGCLTTLFTARSGSTLLCRQLETLYDLGQMGEDLNPPKLQQRPAQEIVAARAAAWFAFKCGRAGLIGAEGSGFFDAYLHKTVFVRLIRRDLVAQAISFVKASQTGQWHAHVVRREEPVFDADRIAAALMKLALGVEQLRRYVESTGRPCATLVYEDVDINGLASAKSIGDLFGLPRRDIAGDGNGDLLRPIDRMSDAINDEWKARFISAMGVSVGKIVEDHLAAADSGGAARWAASPGVRPKTLRKLIGTPSK